MKRLSARLLATVVALLVVTASHARADFLDWGFHWSISASHGIIPSGTGSVAVAVAPDGTGGSIIPAANVTTTSAATSASPDVYKAPYTLTLTLTDNPSHTSGSLTFAGLISGNLTATSSTLTNTFQNSAANPLTQSVTLGGHVYSVTIDPTIANLPIPGSASPALLDAIVKVTNAGTGGGTGSGGGGGHGTPEPTSLVLGGLGFSFFGVGCWWKRKRQAAVESV
jgi:hypothetical protein